MREQSSMPFADIHCHLIPAIDDGATSWEDTLAMARMAVVDGTTTVIATPHQLGAYAKNDAIRIRRATEQLDRFLQQQEVPLRVLPGADVRIEAELAASIRAGKVITLADRGKHVLLELPHELYFHLQPVLEQLANIGIRGILSHPERNHGLLSRPHIVSQLAADGCLMQITAGSVLGSFGDGSQRMAEWMLARGLVHFVASDAHGSTSRRPLLSRAFQRVTELVGVNIATDLFCRNPTAVAEGRAVAPRESMARCSGLRAWFRRMAG